MQLPEEFTNADETTFQFDDDLPSLPVPPLNDTLDRYLDSVRPHVNDEEFSQTQFIVQQFRSGIGKHLQWKLMEKAKHSRNWLRQWWEDKAYLEWRKPIAPLVNFSGPSPFIFTVWPPKEGSQVQRASLNLWFTLQFYKIIRKEELNVDRGSGRAPWCMDQYKNLYNSCRTPGEHIDKLNYHFKLEREGPCPPHVMVMCRGYIFYFDALDEVGEPRPVPELQSQLQYIRDVCDQRPLGPGLGCLTSEHRTTWFELREHLIELHPNHKHYLHLIETSLLSLVLDDRSPEDFTAVSREGLIGDPTNRWFDKSFNMIYFKNGTSSANCDHAPYEAMVLMVSSYFLSRGLDLNGDRWKGTTVVRKQNKPKEIIFHLDETIYKAITQAKANFKEMDDNLEILSTRYMEYGFTFIRKHKFHPDAFVQLAIQLTYYRMHNKPGATYETGSTRKFWMARTETVRSCTLEAIEWSKAMLKPGVSMTTRLGMLKAAAQKHQDLMKNAVEQKGIDRHFLGLYLISEEEGLPIPNIFLDPSYIKSGGGANFIISTSFVGYSAGHGGVAPMCPHGYGCFYSIQADTISLFMSAWTEDEDTSVNGFYHNLQKTFADMKVLLEANEVSMAKL